MGYKQPNDCLCIKTLTWVDCNLVSPSRRMVDVYILIKKCFSLESSNLIWEDPLCCVLLILAVGTRKFES